MPVVASAMETETCPIEDFSESTTPDNTRQHNTFPLAPLPTSQLSKTHSEYRTRTNLLGQCELTRMISRLGCQSPKMGLTLMLPCVDVTNILGLEASFATRSTLIAAIAPAVISDELIWIVSIVN